MNAIVPIPPSDPARLPSRAAELRLLSTVAAISIGGAALGAGGVPVKVAVDGDNAMATSMVYEPRSDVRYTPPPIVLGLPFSYRLR